MNVIIYGDFNCPYSYLASLRADRLIRSGTAGVDWAVEHDRGLAVTGTPSAASRAAWDRELAEVGALRRLITDLMWPAESVLARLASPDLPGALDHDPDLTRIVRRSGGTIAPDGGPLTTTRYRRIRQWRQEWLALPRQVIPAVTGPGGSVYSGSDGLRYLADLAGLAGVPGRATPDLPDGGTAASIRAACLSRPGRAA